MSTSFTTFNLTRTFACPQDTLWTYLTDPKHREVWGAPSDDDVLHLDRSDLREGGKDLLRCGPKESPSYTVETHWYRIDGPDLACFSETVEAGGAKIATTLCTYTLSQAEGGAQLDLDVAVSSFVGPEALDDFKAGWTSALTRLGGMLQTQPA